MSKASYRDTAEKGPSSVGYLALVLAWIVPGLGHWALRERSRGLIFGITIHGLFALGMLLAGLRAINPPDQAIWSYTQWATGWPMAVAVSLAKTRFNQPDTQRMLDAEYAETYAADGYSRDDATAAEREAHAKAFILLHPLFAYHPKVQDIGAVYCGIAGMLNLLVIFDVLLRITGSERETPEKRKRGQLVEAESKPAPASGGA